MSKKILLFCYNLLILLLAYIEDFASYFNVKAKDRKTGINSTLIQLENYMLDSKDQRSIIWFHCASLGEFYQIEPIIDLIKKNDLHQIFLSFYSPSGYEQKKNYRHADVVFYLPTDTKKNAKYLVHLINARLVVFAKYEFWFNYLNQINNSSSDFIYISSIFRLNHYLFRFPISAMSIPILQKANAIFVQNESSVIIGNDNGLDNVIYTGDTRIDAVYKRKNKTLTDKALRRFCGDKEVIVVGSSWGSDESLFKFYTEKNPLVKIIIAPHDIRKERIRHIMSLFGDNAVNYTTWSKEHYDFQVLVIDQIGLLSSLYQLATVAYIGGGFGDGIHNTLEPAVYGIPLVFGPKYKKFEEANYFIKHDLAKSIYDQSSFDLSMLWAMNTSTRLRVENEMRTYFEMNKDSSEKIYKILCDRKLLSV